MCVKVLQSYCIQIMIVYFISCFTLFNEGSTQEFIQDEEYPHGPIRWWSEWDNQNNILWRDEDRWLNRNNPPFNKKFKYPFGIRTGWIVDHFTSQSMTPKTAIRSVIFENLEDDSIFSNSPPTTVRPITSTVAIPGMATTRTPCEDACQATNQFDPVCGNNGVTYTNFQWYKCAVRCGRNVKIRFRGACPRPI
ncbi:uncharacterized protein [Leptinotarsa decemlineata]|uniref:uncharacterized protein n=1 Tax=Leptinotarsa decemlineata TaxID=7539 RepID=UPI003D30B90A